LGEGIPAGAEKAAGIYLSVDRGKTWATSAGLATRPRLDDVTVDPRDARKSCYASGFESSAWKSNDRGENWTRIPGFNFKWGHRVISDPEDPGKSISPPVGGGVWHGSVDGENRPLDIVTPELQPGR